MKYLSTFIFLILFCLISRTLILAAETATVTATVRTELVSITTNVNSIDYGLVTYGVSKALIDVLTITNNGTVNEKIEALGSNAVNRDGTGKLWNLVTITPGVNQYLHYFRVAPTGAFSVLSSDTYITVSDNVSPSSSVSDIDMSFGAPLAGSYSGTFDTNVVFRATKV